MTKFWLVQRMEAAPEGIHLNPFRKVDGMSEQLNTGVMLDYMGAAEFEFGAVPKSGNRIASIAKDLKIVTRQLVTVKIEEPAYFICTKQQQEEGLLDEWEKWTKNPRSKEDTYYFRDRHDWPYAGEYTRNYVGWWALNEDLIWTREENRADTIRQAFIEAAEGVK